MPRPPSDYTPRTQTPHASTAAHLDLPVPSQTALSFCHAFCYVKVSISKIKGVVGVSDYGVRLMLDIKNKVIVIMVIHELERV